MAQVAIGLFEKPLEKIAPREILLAEHHDPAL
jgi:hypothetical protein